jgi:hypothetical protein
MTKVKHFRCDCGWAFHGLEIATDADEQFPPICISVVNARARVTAFNKICMIGNKHLLGHKHSKETLIKMSISHKNVISAIG